MLTNNKICTFKEVEAIAESFKGRELVRLSLHGNMVCNLPNYRMVTIYLFPHLRVLDFQKVTQKERELSNEQMGASYRESASYK